MRFEVAEIVPLHGCGPVPVHPLAFPLMFADQTLKFCAVTQNSMLSSAHDLVNGIINKPAWNSMPLPCLSLCRASWIVFAFVPLVISWILLRPQ